ncbi:hypothetical protein FJR75_05505 [Thermus thermophilus]|nr:hypothetical protein [Thermus thermophilus]
MKRAGYLHLYGLNLVFDRVGKGPPVLLVAEEASRWPEALNAPAFVGADLGLAGGRLAAQLKVGYRF